ncbi:uncharacterized protein J3D65DRAFT_281229 [Phyllosticta citribraziliensis]|uniref:Uncharacterized protein n=1 Tax=Phyllosticta citribraziliensis TaxID=989973 RepID=A0ABR1LY59_9PEZI
MSLRMAAAERWSLRVECHAPKPDCHLEFCRLQTRIACLSGEHEGPPTSNVANLRPEHRNVLRQSTICNGSNRGQRMFARRDGCWCSTCPWKIGNREVGLDGVLALARTKQLIQAVGFARREWETENLVVEDEGRGRKRWDPWVAPDATADAWAIHVCQPHLRSRLSFLPVPSIPQIPCHHQRNHLSFSIAPGRRRLVPQALVVSKHSPLLSPPWPSRHL